MGENDYTERKKSTNLEFAYMEMSKSSLALFLFYFLHSAHLSISLFCRYGYLTASIITYFGDTHIHVNS